MKHSEAGLAFARIAATCLLTTLLATRFLPVTASAADLDNSTGKPAVDQPEGTPRWTVSTEAIVLERLGGAKRTLVERVPGTEPFYGTFAATGPEAFNSSQLGQGVSAGPKIDLIYHGDGGYGAELSYFNIFNQSATKVTGPDSPADWLVMHVPGSFWQTQDFPYQGIAWTGATNLYSAEANGRLALSSRLTLLAGFRWLQLNDSLEGSMTPPDRTAPAWKQSCNLSNCKLSQVTDGNTPAGNYPPFWNTSTVNNLYGFQAGVDGKILEYGRFSLDGAIKAGIYGDDAAQSTGVSMRKLVYPSNASSGSAAFVGDGSLRLKYRITGALALKVGYEALWLDRVALAPGQIQETFTTASSVRALGVNSGSSVLFQGVTAGFEYSF